MGLRSVLIDKFLEIQPGGSRPHFPMVGLKKIPHAVEFSRASGRAGCQQDQCGVSISFSTYGGCGGIDNHVAATNRIDKPRR